jgi:hypothetical protein
MYHKIFMSKKSWVTKCVGDTESFDSPRNTMFPFMFSVADRLCKCGYSLYMDWLDFEAGAGNDYWTKYVAEEGQTNWDFNHVQNVRQALGRAVDRMAKSRVGEGRPFIDTDANLLHKRRMFISLQNAAGEREPPDGPFCGEELCKFHQLDGCDEATYIGAEHGKFGFPGKTFDPKRPPAYIQGCMAGLAAAEIRGETFGADRIKAGEAGVCPDAELLSDEALKILNPNYGLKSTKPFW